MKDKERIERRNQEVGRATGFITEMRMEDGKHIFPGLCWVDMHCPEASSFAVEACK